MSRTTLNQLKKQKPKKQLKDIILSVRGKLLHDNIVDNNFYTKKVITDIIFNEKTREVAFFKDHLIFDDNTEFLKRFYLKSELKQRLNKIYSYYNEFSKIFPNYIILPEAKYIYKNIQRKQRMIDNQQIKDLKDKGRNREKESETEILNTEIMVSINNISCSFINLNENLIERTHFKNSEGLVNKFNRTESIERLIDVIDGKSISYEPLLHNKIKKKNKTFNFYSNEQGSFTSKEQSKVRVPDFNTITITPDNKLSQQQGVKFMLDNKDLKSLILQEKKFKIPSIGKIKKSNFKSSAANVLVNNTNTNSSNSNSKPVAVVANQSKNHLAPIIPPINLQLQSYNSINSPSQTERIKKDTNREVDFKEKLLSTITSSININSNQILRKSIKAIDDLNFRQTMKTPHVSHISHAAPQSNIIYIINQNQHNNLNFYNFDSTENPKINSAPAHQKSQSVNHKKEEVLCEPLKLKSNNKIVLNIDKEKVLKKIKDKASIIVEAAQLGNETEKATLVLKGKKNSVIARSSKMSSISGKVNINNFIKQPVYHNKESRSNLFDTQFPSSVSNKSKTSLVLKQKDSASLQPNRVSKVNVLSQTKLNLISSSSNFNNLQGSQTNRETAKDNKMTQSQSKFQTIQHPSTNKHTKTKSLFS